MAELYLPKELQEVPYLREVFADFMRVLEIVRYSSLRGHADIRAILQKYIGEEFAT